MRIGIVCYPTYGGSGVVATELGKALADEGHQVHFITYQQPVRLNGFNPNIFYHEVQVPSYPLFDYPPYETALSSTMVDVIMNHKLDLLHVHYAIPHASTAYMAKQILKKHGRHIPVVTTLHGTDITLVGKDKTYAPVVTFSINESDMITAVSENLRKETYKYFNIKKDIRVIYNFVDAKRFHKHNASGCGCGKAIAPKGEKILVHVSNFRPVKRVQDVILIFKKVVESIPSKLLLIGDGPDRPFIESMCRELGICKDIRFIGKQDQLEDILGCSDLFLLPSEYESFGLAALEAMASEVPVISSNAGGLPEVNVQGKTGFLSPVGDIDAMADHAIMLLENENMLQQFRKQAYQQAKKFELSKIIPQYENLYRELIPQKKEANA
ncbi:MAG: N-acetyl-alpha-D-glucosaminyl L-malate synthase BshA [Chitinophagaceae bacterium]|jgi:N-acetyl-alpha-D-glucosaminyl L-malate synthase BshA|nr:MAG: N-acetyl-alpha-D-glucosaminyl L-malate synthase BshA [Chitinophagaceae bacterium]